MSPDQDVVLRELLADSPEAVRWHAPTPRPAKNVICLGLYTFSCHSLRHLVGIVPQQIELFTGTLLQNVAYGDPACPIRSYPPRATSAPFAPISRSLNLKLVEPRLATRMSIIVARVFIPC